VASPTPTELAERLQKIEEQLRGEPGADPIDLAALPLNRLQNHLEFAWRPDALQLIQPKSVLAEQIGILPGCRVYLNGNFPVPNAAVTPVEFNNVVYDTDQMVGFNSTPAYATPYGAYYQVKTPGVYVISGGVAWDAYAGGQSSLAIQWRKDSASAWGTVLAEDNKVRNNIYGYGSTVSYVGALAEGNQIRMYVFQDSGIGQTINTFIAQGRYVHYGMQWIGSMPDRGFSTTVGPLLP
jgi:hypothetical protein